MRRFILAAVALLATATSAQAMWSDSGVNISQSVVRRFGDFPHAVPDGQGGVIVAWDTESDWGPYDLDVAVCRVSLDGDVLWSAIVTTEANYQRGSEIIADGAGGAIVVWFDERSAFPGQGIYAQRYDADGVAQWTANGVKLTSDEPSLYQPHGRIRVAPDGSEGAFVVWNNTSPEVWTQHVSGSGSVQWGSFGRLVTLVGSNSKTGVNAVSDGMGGMIVVWEQQLFGAQIVAQRLDFIGTLLWGNNGVILTNATYDQQFPHVVATSTGGAIVAWEDPTMTATDVRMQFLDSAGTPEWGINGIQLTSAVYVNDGSMRLAGDGADGAYVIWTDDRNEPSAEDLFVLHVLNTGVSSPITPITTPNSRVDDQTIIADGKGGAFVTWRLHDTVNGPQLDLVHCQWLDKDLFSFLSSGGQLLYDINAGQFAPQTVAASPGRFITVWNDTRNEPFTTDIFARLVEGNTSEGLNVVITPVDHTTGTTPATLTFGEITAPGATSLTTGPAGPPLPGTFTSTGTYYHLSTTAEFNGMVTVCVTYDPLLLPGPESDAKLLHYDGTAWMDITTSVDTLAHVVCGETTTLSPFAIGTGQVSSGVGGRITGFALHANIPNPFNPVTTIRYDIPPGGADVSIIVYDAVGRRVRELVNAHKGAGTWSAQWNGDDDRGRRVASGVYFYRMTAGAFVETKKMVLLK